MAVPRGHHTKSRRNKGRMHQYIKPVSLSSCRKCGKPVLPHTVCRNCGYYKGTEVIDVMKKLTKKEQKRRKREMAAKEKEEGKREKSLNMEELSRK
ncbi:MAG: 50S ribosomal protein L32 [Candidatus Wildermuthbacteria bacterium RIFCSPHIGHO2_01_FULL_47_27]|uniref:Large ribosomal subunit protein bL32 n=1 Tax=Candidatus Wildermuthbacteria bacterium RIFCSPHIGHO2_02_FULL_47_17 TaxID=1802452 RepID=A0A1G2R3U1_9BACT|nr:MAG: 50S ribosomal protein L32 [Candidatus Wildermuthbacteria bacterium RIFCSPHIGHO2_01_FULL_47_27]OHA67049.1 MAG: 50S ribosomal protein L32 [Candidatus Wildermuthbacteria bacterium RIFCSPHIGHO2_02_FULL_47_17]